jgi:predicted nucleic acid-binding protein
MEVGSRELKDRLSEILHRANAGEEVIASYSNLCISSIGITEVLITLKRRLGLLDSDLAVRLFEAILAFFTILDFDREIGREAVEVSGGKIWPL